MTINDKCGKISVKIKEWKVRILKKILVTIAFMLVTSMLLCACAEKPKDPSGGTEEETSPQSGVSGIVSSFMDRYVRVSGSIGEWNGEVSSRVFRSHKQFESYQQVYFLEQEVQVPGEANIFAEHFVDFPAFLERYNETFFEDSYLVLIQLQEEYDTVRHRTVHVEVREVQGEPKLCVDILRLSQPINNPVEACWYLFLEIDRGDLVIGSSHDIYVTVED